MHKPHTATGSRCPLAHPSLPHAHYPWGPPLLTRAQVRSLVAVGASVWIWLPVHTVVMEHTRLLVGVGATRSYCATGSHLESFAHTRSLVPVGALVSYCCAVHSVQGLHVVAPLGPPSEKVPDAQRAQIVSLRLKNGKHMSEVTQRNVGVRHAGHAVPAAQAEKRQLPPGAQRQIVPLLVTRATLASAALWRD